MKNNSLTLKNSIKLKLNEDLKRADKFMFFLIFIHYIVSFTLSAYIYESYSLGVFVGSIIFFINLITYINYKGTWVFRSVVAISLMVFSALFIQQHLGRIEMHFHIFISISFLTIYKDTIPIFVAGATTILYHYIFNYFQSNGFEIFNTPIYIFNYACGLDVVLLHILFVICEVITIYYIIKYNKARFLELVRTKFELSNLNANLSYIIIDRTKSLRSAKEDAESANRAKSSFLANMSHEIRTPLNAIVGFIDVLEESEKDKEKLKYLKIIKNSSDSLIFIINDILDFAKIESEKVEIELKEFNTHREFNAISTLFYAKAEDLGIEFKLFIDPKIPHCIISDSLRIRQVLTNLLSNAFKFSPINRGIVSLKILYKEKKNSLLFSIKDNGIGISNKNQSKVFDSFTQATQATTREFGGTGLGLSISSKLVKLMGSKIEIKSELNQGSTFYFTLPIRDCKNSNFGFDTDIIKDLKSAKVFLKAQDYYKKVLRIYLESFGITNIVSYSYLNEIEHNNLDVVFISIDSIDDYKIVQTLLNKGIAFIIIKSSLSERLNFKLSGKIEIINPPLTPSNIYDSLMTLFFNKEKKTISDIKESENQYNASVLVAEDNEANQYLIETIFNKIGIKIDIANNGLEAIEKFKKIKYDLIFMDENMPKMNGSQAVKEILNIEKRENLNHTPIIALTANTIKGDREKFLNLGMDEYLSKPINRKILFNVLDKFLQRVQRDENKKYYIDILRVSKEWDFEKDEMLIFADKVLSKSKFYLDNLLKAIEDKNYQDIEFISHAMKSPIGSVRLDNIYNFLSELESLSKDNKIRDSIDFKVKYDELKIMIENVECRV